MTIINTSVEDLDFKPIVKVSPPKSALVRWT